jgi:hypothetical protein
MSVGYGTYGKRYFFLGGIVCTRTARDRLLSSLSQVRDRQLSHEMKWGKVSEAYLDAYKDWTDVFFDDPFSRYSTLCVDLSSRDWQSFSPRRDRQHASDDDRLASLFHQFLLTSFGVLRDTKRWWVFPDAGLFSRDSVLERVEFRFNRTYKGAFGPKSSRVIRLARSRDSSATDLIQLTDVLLGVFSRLFLGSQPTSPAKVALMRHCRVRLDSEPTTCRGLSRLACQRWQPPDRFQYTGRATPRTENGCG